MALINCEIELDFSWSTECMKYERSITHRIPANLDSKPSIQEVLQTTGATFQINNAKRYVPVVAFSVNDSIKILENINVGFKIIISWNKYRPELTKPK